MSAISIIEKNIGGSVRIKTNQTKKELIHSSTLNSLYRTMGILKFGYVKYYTKITTEHLRPTYKDMASKLEKYSKNVLKIRGPTVSR